MEQAQAKALNQSFLIALKHELRRHRFAAAGMAVSVSVIMLLLLQSTLVELQNGGGERFQNALLGGFGGFVSTAVGAFAALLMRNIKARTQDVMLGFAAGMMLAASAFSLVLPGVEAAERLLTLPILAVATVIVGMGLGVLLMLGLDRFTPHEHAKTGPCGPGVERIGRVWLFFLAIALHNLPEGMAIGVSFAENDMSVGMPLTAAILFQNVPEGLAVALALRAALLSPLMAAVVASGTGLMELLGAFIGIGIGTGMPLAYPVGLGLAAGAMIFVVSHEVIPETHRNGHQTPATLGLMGGFSALLVLDTLLG
ncbi:ZIP family metal transporter [Marinobacterium sp. AK62]|uniref:ZIP family metal transporter n=1 Tax=Marinobacterium alkalitolerans TaxID=1542925 RepID=A0ABS3ZEQ6_9GAMM|nr:ZIP family metal transporter [Marinobacterium alkalitolerans]MBP0050185.1 ZIP family metal transporter [Marinobacterium alkalitolerans]